MCLALIMTLTRLMLIFALLCQALPHSVHGQQVYLSIGTTNITTNNSEILITSIGENADGGLPSLMCHTDLPGCCRSDDGMAAGDWYYPSGTMVGRNFEGSEDPFYRTRNKQVARLNRRQGNQPLAPVGSYCCMIPATGREMVTFCAQIVVCPALPTESLPTHGLHYSYNDPGRGVGAEATLICESGYFSSEVRICSTSQLMWTDLTPKCSEACMDLDKPTNGEIMYSDGIANGRPVDTNATYSCDGTVRTCQARRVWSGAVPECALPICHDLPQLLNGNIVYSNGSMNNRSLNSTAMYSCDVGYVLSGTGTRSCQVNTTWSGSEPMCNVTMCPNLTKPDNGEIVLESGPLGDMTVSSTAMYSCDSGYTLEGDISRTCEDDGMWSGSKPTCNGITCLDLPKPENGEIFYNSGSVGNQPFNSIATYSCDPGYSLKGGNTSRTCGNDGMWIGPEPRCNRITCPSLNDPANGRINYTSGPLGVLAVNSTAMYSCEPGYTLDGDKNRTCGNNGMWSGSEPMCNVITCPFLADPTNGEVVLMGLSDGIHAATYHCNSGFILDGDTHRSCQHDGTWTGSEPACNQITCPGLDEPANGSINYTPGPLGVLAVNSTAMYSCEPGYTLDVNESRTCESDGIWSGFEPTCIVIKCSKLVTPANGKVSLKEGPLGDMTVNSTATYHCDLGHTLKGDENRTCQSDKTWSGSEPTCNRNTCSDLPEPGNGGISHSLGSVGKRPFNSIATYHCLPGYTLEGGDTSRMCENGEKWSGSAPMCNVITCPNLADPANGNIILEPGSLGNRSLKSTAMYSCDPGYTLEGDKNRICEGNGTWSDSEPTCNRTTCPSLNEPANGRINYTSGPLGVLAVNSTAMYSCEPGYTLSSGDKNRTCQGNGKWSGQAANCPRELDFKNVTVTEENFQQVATNVSNFTTNTVGNISLQTPEVLGIISEVFDGFANLLLNSSNANITTAEVDNLIKSVAATQNSLVQWVNPDLELSSNVVQSFEKVVSAAVQLTNGSMTFNNNNFTLITKMTEVGKFTEKGTQADFKKTNNVMASIQLPAELFGSDNTGQSVGLFHALYESPTLFGVNDSNTSSGQITVVGTPVIATTVIGEGIDVSNINPPVMIQLEITGTGFINSSVRCVSWNFSTNSWVCDGCKTVQVGNTVHCNCTHLTNFAVLIDICSRSENCTTDPGVHKFLSIISVIGSVLSCIGLVLTIITLLAFKELRQRDNTTHNVQLCLALLALFLVFSPGVDRTEPYAGCVVVSVLIHYFSLVAVMWMGAEAVLMFQKLVIIFGEITKTYLIIVSLICWLVPFVPVIIPLIIDILDSTETDLIIFRNNTDPGAEGYCFLRHPAVFFGAFIGPVLAITFLNLLIFIWITIIVLRSTKNKLERANKKLSPKKALRVMISLMGVSVLFGLSWLCAAFTFHVDQRDVIRYIFLSLFVVCSAFQGVFIFIFFCALDKKARKAWRNVFCKKQKYSPSSLTSSVNSTSTLKKVGTIQETIHDNDTLQYMKPPYIPELEEKLSENGDLSAMLKNMPENGDVAAAEERCSENGDIPAVEERGSENGDIPAVEERGSENGDIPAVEERGSENGDIPAVEEKGGDIPVVAENLPENAESDVPAV